MAKRRPNATETGGLPDADDIVELLKSSNEALPTREIARAFAIKGAQRTELRHRLRELQDSGRIERVQGRRWQIADAMPLVVVLEVVGIDDEGELRVRPAEFAADSPLPEIEVLPVPRSMAAPGPGDRFVARMSPRGDNRYTAKPLRGAQSEAETAIGQFRVGPDGGRIVPLERGRRDEMSVAPTGNADAADGDLVVIELLPARRQGLSQARIVENIGAGDAPGAISRIAIQRAGIPDHFPDAVISEAESAQPPFLGTRTDLRDVPLVTIDGADAHDFDDAVYAQPDPENQDGWHIIVAIADVAAYVGSGGALDREAHRRGNSVYFPDRVVPMLPEALSNGLCSLRPDEDRACLAADLWIEADGTLRRHRFRRALMRSVARPTYEEVQAARYQGHDPVAPGHLEHLYGAFAALSEGRQKRGALELELPERKVILGDDGTVANIVPVQRLDSHRLIEEFMIAANVAAARELQRLRQPAMYRVHDEPDPPKMDDLRELLAGFDIKLVRAGTSRPADFNRILERVRGEPFERTLHELVLRAQMQAEYSPDNIGHFGLGLRDYAHFTSPIRRYADLLVHRALIRGLKLGDDGLSADQAERFEELGEHISKTERRATLAERDANDRYTAAFLAGHVGQSFAGTIRGVTRAGLFVALDENGAEGFVPASRLPGGRPRFDSRSQTLERPGGGTYRLGDNAEVRVAEADGLRGSALFDLMDGGAAAARHRKAPRRKGRSGRKRPDKRRRRRR
ncbi:MAG: ribonuclease R [Alphaproteobacteria bacterium]|nr:ribonuclease R [Alphaproteobacteria bacterium]